MDADVISIETSRSQMELLEAFGASAIRTGSAPASTTSTRRGSRRARRSSALLEKALRQIPAAQLWVNPDCGLKTRTGTKWCRRCRPWWKRPERYGRGYELGAPPPQA